MRIPRGRKGRVLFGVSTLALLMLTACAKDAPQDVLNPAGTDARAADDLWNIVFPIAVVIFVIVEGLLLYAVIRFRHKPGRTAAQFHGNTKLEILLTAAPAAILAGIAVPTVQTIMDLAREPQSALQVTVVAHQFWWEYKYDDQGITTANELHIPTGQPIRITLQGAVQDGVDGTAEVIHSFWVPRLGGTQDIVPGRETTLTLEADEPGTYLGQCKELCGIGHGYMRLLVIAQEPSDFQAWVSGLQQGTASTSGDAATGQDLFENGSDNGAFANGPACASCHSVDAAQAAPNIGPNLGGFAARTTFAGAILDTNESNLRAWLADPAAAKPGAKMPDLGLSQDQIDALVAYLQSLE